MNVFFTLVGLLVLTLVFGGFGYGFYQFGGWGAVVLFGSYVAFSTFCSALLGDS